MTTFQDPPPQSRRAVRQSERGETPDQGPTQEPQPYSFDAAQAPAPTTAPAAAPLQTGRRAQLDAGAAGSAEPLAYVTQGRVPLPQENDPVPARDQAAALNEERVAPPASEIVGEQTLADQPPPESPAFRVRDFSPEGRRSGASRDQFQNISQAPPPVAAPNPATSNPAQNMAPPTVASPPTTATDLDYQTHGVPPVRSHSAAVPVRADDGTNHTLTRRELRELRAAQEEQAPPLQMPESIDTLLNSGPIEIPTLAPAPGQSQALADAMAEFDQLTRARREAEARARDAQVASLGTPAVQPAPPVAPAPAVQPFGVDTAPEQFLQPSAPEAPSAAVSSAPAPTTEPVASIPQPLIEPVPTESAPIDWSAPPVGSSVEQAPPAPQEAAPVEADSLVPEPRAAEAADPTLVDPTLADPMLVDPVFIEPTRASSRPTGHWSVQAEEEVDEVENTVTRTVGTGTSAITTSALVLPSVPQASDLTRPFASTGEILMTGSIDLPHSLGSTGAHPHRIDNSDFEDDPLDSQVAAPDSAPVRAIRAVSTHTSTRGVIENKKPQDNRWLTRVIVAVAALLVVGVAGLVYVLVSHNL